MKKLGLVGGTGPESTLVYYRDINYMVNSHKDGKVFPDISIESINLFRALSYCKEEKYNKLTEYLLAAINNLAKGGADFAALTANTMHIVFDRLQEASPIPLVSIIDTACDSAERESMKKVGLLGTVFTMKGEFFKKPFVERGIEVITPPEEVMLRVNDKIANELELGIVKDETVNELISVTEDMRSNSGIQAVILGCTELPLALNDDNCPVPCLDTMKLHIETLVDMILK